GLASPGPSGRGRPTPRTRRLPSSGACRRASEIAGRLVGRIDLAVLEVALPVPGHDGGGPNPVAIDPRQGAVPVGRAFANEKGVTGAVRDLAQDDGLAVAAITEDAAAAPVRLTLGRLPPE